MLFPCDWCKELKIKNEGWLNEREPVCLDCKSKCNFGKVTGMIKGKVADLTKEEKKEIRKGLMRMYYFVSVVKRIKNDELAGKFKTAYHIIGWLMFIFYFLIPVIFKTEWLRNDYIFLLYSVIYAVLMLFLHSKLAFVLKYLQVRNIAKKCGFKGI